ncbi:hypothetical protein FQN60_012549 [Etheostoma spectabile]|uniref:Ig-like domain-containing protein n=1 Tax=Etheostoma spectabile TaxID=54343 RepID=A0A5J5DPN5_9PERO|nr:hypothetical protein FQN60_012549 [Etheostoma spectabile]
MTTTTTYQGMEPGSKSSSSRNPFESGCTDSAKIDDELKHLIDSLSYYVLSNVIFHEYDDLYLSRVLRPPGGGSNITFGADEKKPPVRKDKMASSVFAEPEDPYANRRNNPPAVPEQKEEAPPADDPAAGLNMASMGILLFFTVIYIRTGHTNTAFVKVECQAGKVGVYGQQSLLQCVVKTTQDNTEIRVVTWKKEGLYDPLLVFTKRKLFQGKAILLLSRPGMKET